MPATISDVIGALRAALARERGETADPVSWPSDGPPLRELAASHCIAPVLAPIADELGLSADDVAWLRRAQQNNSMRALANASQLTAMVTALADAGVRSIVLKGQALAWRTTGDLGGRHAGDLDVLVAPDDLERADQVLRDLGHTRLAGGARSAPFSNPYAGWVRAVDNAVAYEGPGALVELHWQLTRCGLLAIDFEELWTARVEQSGPGFSWSTLGNAHDLTFICVHAAKHRFERLQWLVDVSRSLTSTPDAVRAALAADATARRVVRPVVEAITAADALGPVAVDLDAFPHHDRAVGARLGAHALEELVHPRGRTGALRHNLRLGGSGRYKARTLGRIVVPPILLDQVPLPKPLAFLYVPARPLAMLGLRRKVPGVA